MRVQIERVFSLVFALALCLPVDSADAEVANATWTQWRGPHRDGRIDGADWPDQLSGEHLNQQWRVELGPSYSGPIIANDRVFVTETVDRKSEVVRALDRFSGQQIWEASWSGALSVPFFAKSNGDWIRATPILDGDLLIVAGMRDVLVCLDANTGSELWRIDFVQEFDSPVPAFGFVSSPLIHDDHVYVQAGGGLVKVNKYDGKIVWRVLDDGGGMYGSAFSSPYFAELHGQSQILVQTRTKLASVDPDSGKLLWEQDIPAFRGMNILTPAIAGNSVFTSSYGGRSFLLTPERRGADWAIDESWTNKAQAYMSSPILYDGHLYLHLRNRRFTCLDVTTGQTRWTTKPFGKYWSMVAAGGKILALDQKGELLLIRPNPEQFELIDRRSVAADAWAHLAVCDDQVFIRELDSMSSYRWGLNVRSASLQPPPLHQQGGDGAQQ